MRDALDHCHAGGPALCIVRWRLLRLRCEWLALRRSRFVDAHDAIDAGTRRKYRLFIQCGAAFELAFVIDLDLFVIVIATIVIVAVGITIDAIILVFDQASL